VTEWRTLPLTLRWGSYFAPGVDVEQKLVDMVAQARESGLITRRTAVQRLARQFSIDNVDQYLDALESEHGDAHPTLETAPPKAPPISLTDE